MAIRLGILPGRSEEVRRCTSQALTEAVAAVVPQRAGTQVSTEIREMRDYSKLVL